MDNALLRLMEELLESMDVRDSGDPDTPAWEASMRIRQLEEELSRRLGTMPSGEALRSMVREQELVATA
jgi:hypothetical protein